MSAADTVTLREDLLGAIFNQVAYTGPDLWLTLYTTTSATEIAVDRVQIGIASWDVVTVGNDTHAENNEDVTIYEAPSSTATGAMLMDADVGGNIVCSADFAGGSVVIPEGADVVFSTGELVFSLDHV